MDNSELYALLIASALAFIFFFIEYTQKGPKLQRSFLAGVSLSYFFLVVLPEVSLNLPEIPEFLENFRFVLILFGFAFVHISEKFIFHTAAKEATIRAKELDEREFNLKLVENSISDFITSSISQDQLDLDAVKELNNVVMSLNQNHKEILTEINQIKSNISQKINIRVEKLQDSLKFIYHFLVGAILLGLLQFDLLAGALFFVFAFFMAILSNKSHDLPEIEEYLGLRTNLEPLSKLDDQAKIDSHENHLHSKSTIVVMSASVFFGVIWELFLDTFYDMPLSVLYLSFSFTSGVILYNIMIRVIPRNSKDKPVYFIIGFVLFALFILTINIFAHRFI